MPKNSLNVSLKGADDIFSTEESRQEQQREQVQQIPIDALHPFTNHPFKVLDDEAMTRTVESIAQYGVLAPLIARPRPDGDGYEIISGHRRQYAAKLAGLDTLPVIVRNMDDNAAVLLMVDSNLQREHMLPAHAPPEFADRSILWNSVEQIEKARDSQLAREIEAALPRELSGEQQLALVRAYVKDNFVDKGMCADFAIHDKGTGNPHVHIMLTLRPLKENGQWGAKCRKAYDLDENGQRIPDERGGWKNHREDTTDWNDKGNVEIWRAAWAACTNRALEAAGHPALVDHRSYKRQGIDKIPSVHLGPAANQMEKRGIRTDKGEVNRQIAADNKLLKEIKARITRLYRWSKDEAEKPQTQQSSLTALWEAQQQLNTPRTRAGKIRALQESAALFSFLQANGIQSMQELHKKIADMNSRYYDLRGKIVKAERRIAILTERGEMWEQYNQDKSIHKQLAKVKPEKREQFEQRHSRELILYDAAARYLKELKDSGEGITPKAWQLEIDQLAAGKQTDTLAMKAMREDLKAVERLRKTAEQLSRQERDKSHDREPER